MSFITESSITLPGWKRLHVFLAWTSARNALAMLKWWGVLLVEAIPGSILAGAMLHS